MCSLRILCINSYPTGITFLKFMKFLFLFLFFMISGDDVFKNILLRPLETILSTLQIDNTKSLISKYFLNSLEKDHFTDIAISIIKIMKFKI